MRLIALQKVCAGGVAEVRRQFAVIDLGDEVDQSAGAFMDTAAIMMNLDLVVTSDTAVPHLAGALGVPVWLALPFVPDWRWMLDRCDSPWYPTMRLFRQQQRGNWHGVFDQIEQRCANGLRRKKGTEPPVMASIGEALAIAVRHHQAGRLEAAEQIYRQILAVDANHVDALHLLGVVAHQTGKHEAAVEYIQRAIRFNGGAAVCHNNLGRRTLPCAEYRKRPASYRRALSCKPAMPRPTATWATPSGNRESWTTAVASYRRAVKLKPDFAEAHLEPGALQAQGKLDEAVACYRRALKLKPDFAKAHNNLGNALQATGQARRSGGLLPPCPGAQTRLCRGPQQPGCRLQGAGQPRRRDRLLPPGAGAENRLSRSLQQPGRGLGGTEETRRSGRLLPPGPGTQAGLCPSAPEPGQCLQGSGSWTTRSPAAAGRWQPKPNIPEAYNNLGNAFYDQGKLKEAIACYGRALELKPDLADAHKNRAHTWLLTGDWQRGWPEYVWRLKTKDFALRRCSQPLWGGEPLAAKSILLCAEQGLGDTIQFVRFASVVKQQGATVIVECQQPLLALLQGCPGIDGLVAPGDPLAASDVHAPLVERARHSQYFPANDSGTSALSLPSACAC